MSNYVSKNTLHATRGSVTEKYWWGSGSKVFSWWLGNTNLVPNRFDDGEEDENGVFTLLNNIGIF